jgi:hypothetical protein
MTIFAVMLKMFEINKPETKNWPFCPTTILFIFKIRLYPSKCFELTWEILRLRQK